MRDTAHTHTVSRLIASANELERCMWALWTKKLLVPAHMSYEQILEQFVRVDVPDRYKSPGGDVEDQMRKLTCA